jgi:hypothetical protein
VGNRSAGASLSGKHNRSEGNWACRVREKRDEQTSPHKSAAQYSIGKIIAINWCSGLHSTAHRFAIASNFTRNIRNGQVVELTVIATSNTGVGLQMQD